jgi:hypothetical protein
LHNTAIGASQGHDFAYQLFDFRISLDLLTGKSLPVAPLWSEFVVATGTLAVFILIRRKKFIGASLVVLSALFCFRKLTDYGYVAFFPLVLAYFLSRPQSSGLVLATPQAKLNLCRVYTILGSLYMAGFIRTLLLAWMYLQTGTTYAGTAEQLKTLGVMGQAAHTVVFNSPQPPSFIVFGDGGDNFICGYCQTVGRAVSGEIYLTEDPDGVVIEYSAKYRRQVEYAICVQNNSGKPPAEVLVGAERCELVYDGWRKERPRILGIDLGGTLPGYQFALYKRVETVAPTPSQGER